MGGIEPGTPITTATLTYLARAKIGWMLDPLITNVTFTDNIHQGQNRSHSEYFFDNIRGSNIHPILTLYLYISKNKQKYLCGAGGAGGAG